MLLTTVLLTAAPAGSAATAGAAPASLASATGAGLPAVGTGLRLTVAHGETPVAGTPHVAVLACPPGGTTTHPDPVTACHLLDSVNGDLGRLDVDPGPCNQVYDPYTVTASGTYRGRPLTFQHTYGNHCVLLRTTGAFFDF
ncbi:SSI family serine proteinase inhibitor [Kitasatospora purpeofusca]|uniref:SSI family serine proteinase inhibitor n=1 Tax=Kitasatospora purpeofusca TaxID=67352 RepID=UPI0033D4542B